MLYLVVLGIGQLGGDQLLTISWQLIINIIFISKSSSESVVGCTFIHLSLHDEEFFCWLLVSMATKCSYWSIQGLDGLSPKYMQCMFTLNKNNHNLHSDNKILLPKCHTTNFGLESFAYQTGNLWNKLPYSFRTCESPKDFKTKIVTWSIDMWYIHFTLHFSMFSMC